MVATAGSTLEVIGRDVELAAVDAFVIDCAAGPCALVVEGPPGMGKTTVWRRVGERAAERDLRILSSRGVEVEAKMAFVALSDLLDPVADELLPQVSGPQRAALEVALLRAEAAQEVDPRAVGTGVRSLLISLTDRSPVLIAIDDIQWLDRASAAALAFALRRLGDRPIGIAVTGRTPGDATVPLGLLQAVGQRLRRLRLGPLDLRELHRVVELHLGRSLPRPTMERIYRASAGNPLLALEVARAVIEAGARLAPADPLPVPETVMELVALRVAALPPHSQEALLVAACLAAPTLGLTRQALGSRARAALGPAAEAGLIELHGERLVFPHPLIASAVTETARPAERRLLHRRLGGIVSDTEERARHLALAASGPDSAASLLEAAAIRARTKGAPGVAGDLLQWAAELTSEADQDAGHRRAISAAEHYFRAGDLAYARTLLERMAERVGTPSQRGAVLRLLGQIRYGGDSFDAAIPLLTQALAFSEEPDCAVEILLDLAFAHFNTGDLSRALDAACMAVQQAEQARSRPVLAEALAVEANVRFFTGAGADLPQVQRALAMEDLDRHVQVLMRPSTIAALFSIYLGHLSAGAAGLRALRRRALERGEEIDSRLLTWLARAEILRGELDQAEQIARETLSLAGQTGSDAGRAAALLGIGHVWAIRGDVQRARDNLEASIALLADVGWNVVIEWNRWVLGFLELSAGHDGAAVGAFAQSLAAVESSGVGEPFGVLFVPDATEALIANGQLERAKRLLDVFEGQARALGRTMALMGATRCRALLLARSGAVEQAHEAISESLDLARQSEFPLEWGRSLLVHGQLLRRSRQKQAAREGLGQALATFEQLGARLWADRARAELARVGPPTSPSGVLTPTEQRVAELAGAGHPNREIAGALFISAKTVEANLSRVYRKLGIRSRAELGKIMGERARSSVAPRGTAPT